MVLILDGNSEIGEQSLSFLDREKSQIGFLSTKRPFFPHACATCSKISSNVATMGSWEELRKEYNLIKLLSSTAGSNFDLNQMNFISEDRQQRERE